MHGFKQPAISIKSMYKISWSQLVFVTFHYLAGLDTNGYHAA